MMTTYTDESYSIRREFQLNTYVPIMKRGIESTMRTVDLKIVHLYHIIRSDTINEFINQPSLL